MRELIVLMTGARAWSNADRMTRSLAGIDSRMRAEPERVRITLVHGGAKGADTMAAETAGRLGWQVQEFPAHWENGRGAGLVRNAEMVDWCVARQEEDSETRVLCLSFISGESRGTRHCMRLMRKAELFVIEHIDIA